MKKFKKMLAGLLGAAMVLTSFGTPAWATSTNPEKTTATIDTTKKVVSQFTSMSIMEQEELKELVKFLMQAKYHLGQSR